MSIEDISGKRQVLPIAHDHSWQVLAFSGCGVDNHLDLPDYRLLSLLGGEQTWRPLKDELSSIFLQLRRIFLEQGFNPLLLELAVIRDRRESTHTGDSFASHFACFVETQEGQSTLKAWKNMVSLLVEESAGEGSRRLDLVPNPRTYEYVFHATPLTCPFHFAPSEELERIPFLDSTPYELPNTIGSTGYPLSLPDNMRRISDLFQKCAQEEFALGATSTSACWLFVVPFFRVIEYAEASVNALWSNFGGRPGGCLIGLLQGRGGSPESLELALIRLSWLLHKGAFVESEAHANEHRYRRDLLRTLGHAVANPMVSAENQLYMLLGAITSRLGGDELKELAELTRTRFRAAVAATRCIEYLIHLGPGGDPDAREGIIKTLQAGGVRLDELLSSFAAEDFLSKNEVTLDRQHLASLADVRLSGAPEAWWLILYLLLKNASEASPRGAAVRLEFSYDSLFERAGLRVANLLAGPISGARFNDMNSALSGTITHLSPNRDKSVSSGLGIATVGQVLRALRLRDFKYHLAAGIDSDSMITFELFDIPASRLGG